VTVNKTVNQKGKRR